MKGLLHICAMGACRNVPDRREYYLRKLGECKPKMLVLNAIRGKLINRVFACVNEDRLYTSYIKRAAEESPAADVTKQDAAMANADY